MNARVRWITMMIMLLMLSLTSCTGATTEAPPAMEVSHEEVTTTTVAPIATSTETEPARPPVEEIRFRSGDFEVVGDLRFPAGDEPYPAIIMVHGDGPATRHGAVNFGPTIEIFQRNGYAVFSWDKPGSGESTGEFGEGHGLEQRAAILADGINVLVEHPTIDSTRIGLWGISQAGWVMPLALELTDDVAFMIVVSGGAEDSIEQMVYQFGQRVLSAGGSLEHADLVEQYGSQALKATNYTDYREAMEILREIPDVEARIGIDLDMAEEDEWLPWPRDIDAFFNPMDVIEHTTIPVLVFFGEFDKDVDPVQGAEAYEAALQKAGNQDYQIEVISATGHVFVTLPKYLETLEAWLQHLLQ
jgi:pimeloyl-ACP methyl ester carboxylesterase